MLDHVRELVGDKLAAVSLAWIFAAAEMNVFSSSDSAGVEVVGTGIAVDADSREIRAKGEFHRAAQ